MFTGIVEEQGLIKQMTPTTLTLTASQILTDVAIKDSIAVDGICLTVIDLGPDWFQVETMPETQRRTRLGSLQPGAKVNLERSLSAQGRIGGHMVQGHIEASVVVRTITADGIGRCVEIELPAELRPYVITKGFVALNGVSLTIVEARNDVFSIALIPYTQEHTNLGGVVPGTLLNLETDILGRYVAQFVKFRQEA